MVGLFDRSRLRKLLQLADSNVSMIQKNFDVIVERTAHELNGESCMALEDAPPPKQQIVNSRSLGQRVTELEYMQQAVVLGTGKRPRAGAFLVLM